MRIATFDRHSVALSASGDEQLLRELIGSWEWPLQDGRFRAETKQSFGDYYGCRDGIQIDIFDYPTADDIKNGALVSGQRRAVVTTFYYRRMKRGGRDGRDRTSREFLFHKDDPMPPRELVVHLMKCVNRIGGDWERIQ